MRLSLSSTDLKGNPNHSIRALGRLTQEKDGDRERACKHVHHLDEVALEQVSE